MITEIAEAILDKFKKNKALSKGLTGGLFFQQGYQEATYPYGVFYLISMDMQDYLGATASDNRMFKATIQFNLLSNKTDGGEEALKLAEYLIKCYDWCESTLVLQDYYCVKVERRPTSPALLYTDEIWQSIVEYEIWYSKE